MATYLLTSYLTTLKGTIITFSLLFAFSLRAMAQNSTLITGRVLRESTKEPVPYAHLTIVGTGIGTIANGEGRFRLIVPIAYEGKQVKISCIGYADYLFPIKKDGEENLIVLLNESSHALESVTIKPDDLAKKIILQAIENIPINYPDGPEILKGFVTEKAYPDSSRQDAPFYIVEAAIEAYKDPYSKASTNGAIKLLKGRRFMGANIDSLPIRFYGGVHEPHRFDFVMRRNGPLDRGKINRFFFEIEDTLKYGNKDIVVISFASLKDEDHGKLHIALDSYAITKAEIRTTSSGLFDGLSYTASGYNRLFRRYITTYAHEDAVWRLKHIQYNTYFQSDESRSNVYLKTDFVTTDFYEQNEALPYLEKFHYKDVFLNSLGEYDEHFWKDYNIILPDVSENHLILTENTKELGSENKQEKMLKIIKKIRLDYSLFYFKSNLSSTVATMPGLPKALSIQEQAYHYLGLSTRLQYEIYDQFIVGLENQASFSNKRFSGNWLTFAYEANINPRRRPIYVSPAFKAGYVKQRLFLESFSQESETEINGKNFDSKKIDAFYETRGFSIAPSITIAIEKSKSWRYFVSATYPFQIHPTQGLFLREKEFFLTRKSTFVKEGKQGLHFGESNKSQFNNNLEFAAGIVWKF